MCKRRRDVYSLEVFRVTLFIHPNDEDFFLSLNLSYNTLMNQCWLINGFLDQTFHRFYLPSICTDLY